MKLPSKYQIGESVLLKHSYPPDAGYFPGEICKVEFGKYSDGHDAIKYSVKTATGVYHGQLESQIKKAPEEFMGLKLKKVSHNQQSPVCYVDEYETDFHTIRELSYWVTESNTQSVTIFGKTFKPKELEQLANKLIYLETERIT